MTHYIIQYMFFSVVIQGVEGANVNSLLTV